MKMAASIPGRAGRLLVMLWMTGVAMAGGDTPGAPDAKVVSTGTGTAVSANENVVCESAPLLTNPRLSPWTKEIVKLTQSGIEEGVIVAFIENAGTFGLGADQVIYLNDIGVSGQVIGAMLQHDRELVSGERWLTIVSEPPYEPLFVGKAVAGSEPAAEPVKSTAVTPLPVVEPAAAAKPAAAPAQVAPVQESLEPTSRFTSLPTTQSPEKKRPLYPVREPYPVELLPPIVFFNVADIPANTVVVYGLP